MSEEGSEVLRGFKAGPDLNDLKMFAGAYRLFQNFVRSNRTTNRRVLQKLQGRRGRLQPKQIKNFPESRNCRKNAKRPSTAREN